jgi:hypothetical protein
MGKGNRCRDLPEFPQILDGEAVKNLWGTLSYGFAIGGAPGFKLSQRGSAGIFWGCWGDLRSKTVSRSAGIPTHRAQNARCDGAPSVGVLR